MFINQNSLLIELEFTGEDWSLGYRTGKKYNLKIELGKMIVVQRNEEAKTFLDIVTDRIFKNGLCPYASLGAFLSNWKLPEGEIVPTLYSHLPTLFLNN